MEHEVKPCDKRIGPVQIIELIIFNVKWMLIPFYLGLGCVLAMYGYVFSKELVKTFQTIGTLDRDSVVLVALDFIDMGMIGNLIKLVCTGSYNSFVSKAHGYKNENVSSGTLKIKITTSMLTVGGIHILAKLLESHDTNESIKLYGALITVAVALAAIEYIHTKTEILEHNIQHAEKEGEKHETKPESH